MNIKEISFCRSSPSREEFNLSTETKYHILHFISVFTCRPFALIENLRMYGLHSLDSLFAARPNPPF